MAHKSEENSSSNIIRNAGFIALIILGLFFLIQGVVIAKTLLIPIAIASLLSMLLMPLDRKLRSIGINKGISILICDFIVLLAFAGLFLLVSAQINSVINDWPEIKERVEPLIEKARTTIQEKTGSSISSYLPDKAGFAQRLQTFSGSFLGAISSTLLVFIYIFFFMFYRHKFKGFILRMVPDEKKAKSEKVIAKASKVSQQYLTGKMITITILAICYAVSFSILGIRYAILISILAAILDLIPYIGNIIAFILTASLAFISGGEVNTFIWLGITFAVIQFLQSYILEPFIVGQKVNLNPLFTILAVIVGGAIWGVAGMILAIPVLGILKVIFDNVPALNPFGYLIGDDQNGSAESGIISKIKTWFNNIKS